MNSGYLAKIDSHGVGFDLRLDHKAQQLGPVEVTQWWVDQRRIRPSNTKQNKPEFAEIVSGFQNICKRRDDCTLQDEYTILLASVQPQLRSRGSREVFLDSLLQNKSKDKKARVEKLQKTLEAQSEAEISELDFSNQTFASLGADLRDVTSEVQEKFRVIQSELLEDATYLLWKDPAAARKLV